MEKEVLVLTLNLFLRPPLIKTNDSDYKNLRTLCFMQYFSPKYDIICLQEVFSSFNCRRKFIKAAAKAQGFLYSYENPSPKFFLGQLIDGGLLILSKYPIIESDYIIYSNATGPDCLSAKGSIYAKVLINNTPFHIFTTHMQSSYPTLRYSEFLKYRVIRRNQLQELKSFIDRKIHLSQDPVIITGDFNIDGKETVKKPKFEVICN